MEMQVECLPIYIWHQSYRKATLGSFWKHARPSAGKGNCATDDRVKLLHQNTHFAMRRSVSRLKTRFVKSVTDSICKHKRTACNASKSCWDRTVSWPFFSFSCCSSCCSRRHSFSFLRRTSAET